MKRYFAEIERTDTLYIEFEFPDGEEPTEEDVLNATSYVENHKDTLIGQERVVIFYEEEDE